MNIIMGDEQIDELENLDNELQQDLENIEQKKEHELQNPVDGHYVNNKELLEEFKKYKKQYTEWVNNGKQGVKPRLSNKIATAILNIAHKRCNSWQFVNYTLDWKEEMVDDAIEICVRYAHNFNPDKSDNPFAYLTQMVNNALKNRIKIEQKNLYIKAKAFDNKRAFQADGDHEGESLNETDDLYKDKLNFISDYEERNDLNKKRKRKNKTQGVNILDEIDDDNENE